METILDGGYHQMIWGFWLGMMLFVFGGSALDRYKKNARQRRKERELARQFHPTIPTGLIGDYRATRLPRDPNFRVTGKTSSREFCKKFDITLDDA